MPAGPQLRRIRQSEFACHPKAFWRAASQRLQAANILLESGIYLDAVYLAGYVVERALKALILQRAPARRRGQVGEELTSGARSHNFDVLLAILRSKGCPPPPEIVRFLDSLHDEWRTDLRYVGTLIPEREATHFLERVRAGYEWAERNL